MNWFRCGKMRLLYLLALAQLAGGPLVLLQVTLFCKLSLGEVPRLGVKQAALAAWHETGQRADAADLPAPHRKDKAPADTTAGKAKMPAATWRMPDLLLAGCETPYLQVWLSHVWTPAWPQAPPGPPPRLG